jgi:O-antigen ligase
VGYFSIDRNATFGGLLNQIGLVAVFFLVVALTTSRKRLNCLLLVLAGVGIAEAFYGLILYFSGSDMGLWNPGHMPTTVSGTFINQNHFAGMMELTISVVIGLVLAEGELHGGRRGATSFAWRLTELALSRRGILIFFLVVMISALIMTTSRGAIGALVVAISGTFLLAARKRRFWSSNFRVGLVLICLVVVSMAWLGTGKFFEKVRESGIESNRGDLREVSYRMFKDNPIVGTGVGTYRWAFPVYKDGRFGSGFYEHAHNDFLEILTEQGSLGFLLIFGAIFAVLCRIGRALMRRHDPLMRGALFAGFAGCSSLLIHGLVDFNLQIPANASYFFVLLGIGLVASNLEGSEAGG